MFLTYLHIGNFVRIVASGFWSVKRHLVARKKMALVHRDMYLSDCGRPVVTGEHASMGDESSSVYEMVRSLARDLVGAAHRPERSLYMEMLSRRSALYWIRRPEGLGRPVGAGFVVMTVSFYATDALFDRLKRMREKLPSGVTAFAWVARDPGWLWRSRFRPAGESSTSCVLLLTGVPVDMDAGAVAQLLLGDDGREDRQCHREWSSGWWLEAFCTEEDQRIWYHGHASLLRETECCMVTTSGVVEKYLPCLVDDVDSEESDGSSSVETVRAGGREPLLELRLDEVNKRRRRR